MSFFLSVHFVTNQTLSCYTFTGKQQFPLFLQKKYTEIQINSKTKASDIKVGYL